MAFNCISVDGDTSTNDTFIALANGKAENSVIHKGTKEELDFQKAFTYVSAELAKMMVVDGEGALGLHANSGDRPAWYR